MTSITQSQVSNEKTLANCLGYIRDEQLASYIVIMIDHYKDPY